MSFLLLKEKFRFRLNDNCRADAAPVLFQPFDGVIAQSPAENERHGVFRGWLRGGPALGFAQRIVFAVQEALPFIDRHGDGRRSPFSHHPFGVKRTGFDSAALNHRPGGRKPPGENLPIVTFERIGHALSYRKILDGSKSRPLSV